MISPVQKIMKLEREKEELQQKNEELRKEIDHILKDTDKALYGYMESHKAAAVTFKNERDRLQKRIDAVTDAMKGTVPIKIEQFQALTTQAVKLQKAQDRLTAVYHILVMLNKERKDNTVIELLQTLRQPL